MDNGLIGAALFAAICFICPMLVFVIIVYAGVFIIGVPLLIIGKVIGFLGFNYLWAHFGLLGVIPLAAVYMFVIWVAWVLIFDN